MTGLNNKILFCAYLLLITVNGYAAASASHRVAVTVAPISQVAVLGGDIALSIDQYVGDGLIQSLPNTDTGLAWGSNQGDRKITVATNLTDPEYILAIEATSISGSSNATASGSVTIDAEPQDLLDNIDVGLGECSLVYTAATVLGSNRSTETHTITYTITSQ